MPANTRPTKPDTPATTVDEFIDAVGNQGSRDASTPEDITVDGYAGKKIILEMADDVDIHHLRRRRRQSHHVRDARR